MKATITIASLLLLSCSKKASYNHPQEAELTQAATEMVARNRSGIISIDDKSANRRIYLLYKPETPFPSADPNQVILLMPNWTKGQSEADKAIEYFERNKSKKENIVLLTSDEVQDGELFGLANFSWKMVYKSDHVTEAVGDVLGAFYEIYDISSSTKLRISESWLTGTDYRIITSFRIMPDGKIEG